MKNKKGEDGQTLKCFTCKSEYHFSTNCPKLKEEDEKKEVKKKKRKSKKKDSDSSTDDTDD